MSLNNFVYEKISLPNDFEGEVKATFIKSNKNIKGQVPVLYLHGFVDYFFHPHVANEFHKHEFNFYALELRKYGHSYMDHQHPNYCESLEEYFEEIDIALQKIFEIDNQKILFLGHSTGALIGSLYADSGNKKELIKALILNSPFLEINAPGLVRKLSVPIMKMAIKANKFANLPNALSPLYPRSIHKDFEGEWDFDLSHKPIKGFPAYFHWLLAIKQGQDQVKEGLNTKIPILVMHSSSSFLPRKWKDEIHYSDVVLNVDDMKRYGSNLGENVDLIEIQNGRHDLFLSYKEPRELAFKEMFSWIRKLN